MNKYLIAFFLSVLGLSLTGMEQQQEIKQTEEMKQVLQPKSLAELSVDAVANQIKKMIEEQVEFEQHITKLDLPQSDNDSDDDDNDEFIDNAVQLLTKLPFEMQLQVLETLLQKYPAVQFWQNSAHTIPKLFSSSFEYPLSLREFFEQIIDNMVDRVKDGLLTTKVANNYTAQLANLLLQYQNVFSTKPLLIDLAISTTANPDPDDELINFLNLIFQSATDQEKFEAMYMLAFDAATNHLTTAPEKLVFELQLAAFDALLKKGISPLLSGTQEESLLLIIKNWANAAAKQDGDLQINLMQDDGSPASFTMKKNNIEQLLAILQKYTTVE